MRDGGWVRIFGLALLVGSPLATAFAQDAETARAEAYAGR